MRGGRGRPGPFFIAGTGRCGTTQLRAILGQHPEVHALEHETRFLVDPGGLEDLAHTLTRAYTPYHGADALRRFDDLMRVKLLGRDPTTFVGWRLSEEIGPTRYFDALTTLWNQLAWYTYEEHVPPAGLVDGATSHGPFEPRTVQRVVPRYYQDRASLIAILREYVDTLFSGVARDHDKTTWCEKTPFNLLSMPFLWELFPEATILHVMRHPIAVVASYLVQPWAPKTVSGVLDWLEPIYRRWLADRALLPLDRCRLVEWKLEDLARDWDATRPRLFAQLGLPDWKTSFRLKLAVVTYRHGQMSTADQHECEERLGWAMDALGYRRASTSDPSLEKLSSRFAS